MTLSRPTQDIKFTKMSRNSKKEEPASRRIFPSNISLTAAGFFIVPRHVLGRGHIALSDKLNIAGIGAGGNGKGDLRNFAESKKVNIVALCDVDDRQVVVDREEYNLMV